MSLIQKEEYGLLNGKCVECNACGHTQCCGPELCKMNNSSSMCKMYLLELQNNYKEYQKVLKLLFENKEKYKDLHIDLENIREDFY